jgi:hypothetical protein
VGLCREDADTGRQVDQGDLEKLAEMKTLFTTWMKEVGAKDVAPNPAYDAKRPLFNARDEALRAGKAGKK